MPARLIPFSDEQRRLLINIRQHYEVWMEAEQTSDRLPYGMHWKSIGGRDYLYEIRDRAGNGRSLGRRSETTEARYAEYRDEKEGVRARLDGSKSTLADSTRQYRALRLPMIPSPAAAILREADRRGLLGSQLLVVGTNAMAAYLIDAGGRIEDVPDETMDFDMAWSSEEILEDPAPVWTMLKAVDKTYTVNTERPFQARNAQAYEVELLVSPSALATMSRRDQPRPVPLPEQEWLLRGQRVSHVVTGRDASPARLVVPDPRWFALQKLWLAEQAKRDPLKRPKDEKQGMALLDVVDRHMRDYPVDDAFRSELPTELVPQFDRWAAGRGDENREDLGW